MNQRKTIDTLIELELDDILEIIRQDVPQLTGEIDPETRSDMISFAWTDVLKAIPRFDFNRGVNFERFIRIVIRRSFIKKYYRYRFENKEKAK